MHLCISAKSQIVIIHGRLIIKYGIMVAAWLYVYHLYIYINANYICMGLYIYIYIYIYIYTYICILNDNIYIIYNNYRLL